MPQNEGTVIWCIAEYEDGTKGYFGINCDVYVGDGELSVAEEKQLKGALRPGKIVRAYKPKPQGFV